jgi:ubiquinone/menaquinone biosynthesis C-methylase UbiE
MKRRLMSIYWSIKKVLAPDVIGSQVRYADFLRRYLKSRPRWLDLGCGHQFLPDWAWIPDTALLRSLPRIVGTDANVESLKRHALLTGRVASDITWLPFQSGSFDLVTANMVMEHVRDPEQVLREVRRVLAPGGVFLCHTPNLSSPLIAVAALIPQRQKNWLIGFFEERSEDDIYPAVYNFNTLEAVSSVSARAGFRLEACEFVVSEAVTQVLGPFAIPELLYIRLTQWKALAKLRPDMVAVLRPENLPGKGVTASKQVSPSTFSG